MLRAKVCRRAPRLRLGKLGGLLALLPGLVSLSSLKRGCRSDGGVVARETRPTTHWHGHRSLRLRTRPVQAPVCLPDSRRWHGRWHQSPQFAKPSTIARSQRGEKSLILYEKSGARGIRTLDTSFPVYRISRKRTWPDWARLRPSPECKRDDRTASNRLGPTPNWHRRWHHPRARNRRRSVAPSTGPRCDVADCTRGRRRYGPQVTERSCGQRSSS
jgi:hypothetical protein